jgi:hypothetical protein
MPFFGAQFPAEDGAYMVERDCGASVFDDQTADWEWNDRAMIW